MSSTSYADDRAVELLLVRAALRRSGDLILKASEASSTRKYPELIRSLSSRLLLLTGCGERGMEEVQEREEGAPLMWWLTEEREGGAWALAEGGEVYVRRREERGAWGPRGVQRLLAGLFALAAVLLALLPGEHLQLTGLMVSICLCLTLGSWVLPTKRAEETPLFLPWGWEEAGRERELAERLGVLLREGMERLDQLVQREGEGLLEAAADTTSKEER